MDTYALVPYGSRPFPEAHPDRLCAIARLFQLPARDPRGAQVLEIGCGAAMHLLSAAARLPGASFVGVDRSGESIERGRALQRHLSANNAELIEADLLDIDRVLSREGLPARYDYIIAHGVYSWVPPEIGGALLETCSRWLSETGVAYVSYNTMPGWSLRRSIADMMRFHTAGFSSPDRQILQARALLDFLAQSVPETDPYGAWLRRERKLTEDQPDEWIFHDLLAEHNRAVYLHEIVAEAERYGLSYLGDAEIHTMLPDRLPEDVRRTLRSLGDDQVRAEQYLDFVLGRSFRRSLLVRSGAGRIDRNLDGSRLSGLFVRALFEQQGRSEGSWQFQADTGESLSTESPLAASLLLSLAQHRPSPMPFDEIVAPDPEGLSKSLLLCALRGLVALHPRPVALAATPDQRPRACPVAAALCQRPDKAPWTVSLLHEMVPIDAIDRVLLPLLDGTRASPDLALALREAARTGSLLLGGDIEESLGLVERDLPRRLAGYARSGLLTA